MIRRPRRSIPATVVALVLLALCVLVAVAVVQSLLGRTPFVSLTQLLAVTSASTWGSAVAITVAVVLAVLGLVLLVAALRPGKPTVMPLARLTDPDGAPMADAGVRRASLAKDLTAAARALPGVTSATVAAGRATVTATVGVFASNTDEVSGQVRARLTERLVDIGPAPTPKVRVRAHSDRKT